MTTCTYVNHTAPALRFQGEMAFLSTEGEMAPDTGTLVSYLHI